MNTINSLIAIQKAIHGTVHNIASVNVKKDSGESSDINLTEELISLIQQQQAYESMVEVVSTENIMIKRLLAVV